MPVTWSHFSSIGLKSVHRYIMSSSFNMYTLKKISLQFREFMFSLCHSPSIQPLSAMVFFQNRGLELQIQTRWSELHLVPILAWWSAPAPTRVPSSHLIWRANIPPPTPLSPCHQDSTLPRAHCLLLLKPRGRSKCNSNFSSQKNILHFALVNLLIMSVVSSNVSIVRCYRVECL